MGRLWAGYGIVNENVYAACMGTLSPPRAPGTSDTRTSYVPLPGAAASVNTSRHCRDIARGRDRAQARNDGAQRGAGSGMLRGA